MVIQQALNNEKMIFSARDFTIYFQYDKEELPWYTTGWEELFKNANPVEKSIYFIEQVGGLMDRSRSTISENHKDQILTIPFEKFVFDPMLYMENIAAVLGSKITGQTLRVMKKQNVPRKKISDGIPLEVYKRCGWVPPKAGLSERDELKARREFAAQTASSEAMMVLDRLSANYEEKYLGGIIT
jgi:hypothetical protein